MLLLHPLDDEGFCRHAQELAAGDITSTGELQRRLRETYPLAVVRRRGLTGEPYDAWYVYRDGRWTTAAERAGERHGDERRGRRP